MTEPVQIEFKLSPPALRFSVEVRLRRAGDRWIADAAADGIVRTGIGAAPRVALAAALEPLGAAPVRALLADLGLLEPSVQVLGLSAVAGA